MKTSTRRFRRRPSSREAIQSNKDNRNEHLFFGESGYEPFFKPVSSVPSAETVNRKCPDCEKEEKKALRLPEEKKGKEKLHRSPDKKEEKKLMKKEEEKEEKKDKIQKKESGLTSGNSAGTASNYINSINSKGQNMDAGLQSFFGSKMNGDFSDVKIHTGKEASDSAKELNAKAYTIGNHIIFNDGQYNPESTEGKKLMAHELTHVLQQNPDNQLSRKGLADEPENEPIAVPTYFERDIVEQNTRHFANCNGVSVQGYTDAHYGNSFTAPGTSTPAGNCPDCSTEDCVVNKGIVISDFTANPQITLPPVPSGLNECEQNAVQQFINTTLRAHEQQHVAAFNTYAGTLKTPYRYRGCASGLETYQQQIHDRIEAPRKSRSDAASAALDAGGANIFNVNCNCPDPKPGAGE